MADVVRVHPRLWAGSLKEATVLVQRDWLVKNILGGEAIVAVSGELLGPEETRRPRTTLLNVGTASLPQCVVATPGHQPGVEYAKSDPAVLKDLLVTAREAPGLLLTPSQLQSVAFANSVDPLACRLELCLKAKKRELQLNWNFKGGLADALLQIKQGQASADQASRLNAGEAPPS
eukprot:gene7813-1010_t